MKPLMRMPYGFGPTPGPRQDPDGKPHDWHDGPKSRAVILRFLSEAEALVPLLPPGFLLDGDPWVTIRYTELTELAWLAGRGYRMLGVYFPAVYRGRREEARGPFLAVLWENLADPILSGREELGYAKLPAEISAPRRTGGSEKMRAAWQGHPFFDLSLADFRTEPTEEMAAASPPADGVLHYKYIPRTGDPGQADCAYACLTPPPGPIRRLVGVESASAEWAFHPASWEEMPTQCHVVSALANLPVHESARARIETTIGASDLSGQKRLD